MYPDISTIGEFAYSWDFDNEEYEEYLQENELENTQENLMEYIRDNVTFTVDFKDNETFHTFAYESMMLDEIESEYGEELSNMVLSDCMKDGEGYVETCTLYNEEIDVNNPDEVNRLAVKLLQHGEYYKDCRGFILTNGVVVYTPNEHNQCTVIDGVKGTYHFIKLGNIRVLQNSIDIAKRPTNEQRGVLAKVISCYSNDTLYVDVDGNSVTYTNPNWRYVLGEIERYFEDGIRPQGRNFYESKKRKNGKVIRIDEKQMEELKHASSLDYIFESAFCPKADVVIEIKGFLDDNFARQELDDLDTNGYPTKDRTVIWLSKEKQPLKTLAMAELLLLLDDKFRKRISNDEDRKKFLKQVITDWYFKRIKNNGILSVNHL